MNEEKLPGVAEFTKEFFDASSRAWRLNKVRVQRKAKWSGMFRYGCEYVRVNGLLCKRKLINSSSKYCKYHSRKRGYAGIE